MFIDYLHSPIGWLAIKATDKGICFINYISAPPQAPCPNILTRQCKQQLEEYFTGKRHSFDIALDVSGTDFQKSVWQALSDIPFANNASYLDIAKAIGKPKAVRAVGAANAKNPTSIIVPCHRVIGVNKQLIGYAGGLDRKSWLLNHEGIKFIAQQAIYKPSVSLNRGIINPLIDH